MICSDVNASIPTIVNCLKQGAFGADTTIFAVLVFFCLGLLMYYLRIPQRFVFAVAVIVTYLFTFISPVFMTLLIIESFAMAFLIVRGLQAAMKEY
jgi:hypothetical protein